MPNTTLELAQLSLRDTLKTAIRRTELKNFADMLERETQRLLCKLGYEDKIYLLEQLSGLSHGWAMEHQIVMESNADETVNLDQPF